MEARRACSNADSDWVGSGWGPGSYISNELQVMLRDQDPETTGQQGSQSLPSSPGYEHLKGTSRVPSDVCGRLHLGWAQLKRKQRTTKP